MSERNESASYFDEERLQGIGTEGEWKELAQLYPDGCLVKVKKPDNKEAYAVIRHPEEPGKPLRMQVVAQEDGVWKLTDIVAPIPIAPLELVMKNVLSRVEENPPVIVGYNEGDRLSENAVG